MTASRTKMTAESLLVGSMRDLGNSSSVICRLLS
jgi:hypothetical protein